MRRLSILSLCLCVLMLSACADKWEKKGASDQDFQVAQAACFSSASEKFPPHIRPIEAQPGYTTPLLSQCSQTPYAINCMQRGGDYIPPAVLNTDDNADAREAEMRSCLSQRGWHLVADEGLF